MLADRLFCKFSSLLDRSETAKNIFIGVSCAFDPNPVVDSNVLEFRVSHMVFSDGFSKDNANLLADRIAGERKVFGESYITADYGKATIPA